MTLDYGWILRQSLRNTTILADKKVKNVFSSIGD